MFKEVGLVDGFRLITITSIVSIVKILKNSLRKMLIAGKVNVLFNAVEQRIVYLSRGSSIA